MSFWILTETNFDTSKSKWLTSVSQINREMNRKFSVDPDTPSFSASADEQQQNVISAETIIKTKVDFLKIFRLFSIEKSIDKGSSKLQEFKN